MIQILRIAAIAALSLVCATGVAKASEKQPDFAAIIETSEHLLRSLATGTITSELVSGLNDFALQARTTAFAIDASDGAADLACIYRGMAEDIEFRLANAAAGDPHAAEDLRALLQDAIDVTPRTKKEAEPIGPDSFECHATGADPFDLASVLH